MTLLHQAAQKAVEALMEVDRACDRPLIEALEAALRLPAEPSKTRDVASIWHFLTPQQMAEEIIRQDAVIAGRGPNILMGRLPPPALQHQEVPREPVAADAKSILEQVANAPNEENCAMCNGRGFYGIPGQRCSFCKGTGRVQWRSAPDAASPSATRQQEVGSEPQDCPVCKNGYLAIRTDIYKDGREFVYCDCCGCMADRRVWNRIAAAPSTPENAGGVKEARDPELWAVHVQGSDDVHAAPSKAEAEAAAQRFNEWAANRPDQHELDPIMHAVAVPWAYSPGAHKCALPHWPEFAGNAGAEGKCECGLSEAACRDPLRRSCPDGVKEADRG